MITSTLTIRHLRQSVRIQYKNYPDRKPVEGVLQSVYDDGSFEIISHCGTTTYLFQWHDIKGFIIEVINGEDQ